MVETTFDAAQVLALVYAEIEERFAGVNDLAHGWEHVSRVYRLANYLAEQENADNFVVSMATLMHDLGHTAPAESGQHHADLSVQLATGVMSARGVPLELQDAIVHAIVAHSFSRGVEPCTLEAYIVRDADRLDGLGAIGVLRWAIVTAQRSTLQSRAYHPTDPFAEHHALDDKTYALDHFYKKLLRLADSVSTETGRGLARERTAFMQIYLAQFQKELDY